MVEIQIVEGGRRSGRRRGSAEEEKEAYLLVATPLLYSTVKEIFELVSHP